MKKLIAELPMLIAPKEKGGANHIPSRGQGSYHRSLNDRKGRPRTSIKGQILTDSIVKRPDEESPDELMAEPEELPEPWTLFTDGSSCIDGSGAD
ncbi:hypothetical protein Tco_0260372 [Tanacetum coccineum]